MLAKLLDVAVPANPDAVVIVVHGSGSRGDRMHVSPAQLSVLRMIPTAHRVVREGRGRTGRPAAAELLPRLGQPPHAGR